jgi:hypothetical protein
MHAGAALCLSTDGMYETAVRTRTMGQVDGPDPLRAQTGMRMRAAAVRTRLSFFVAGRPERDLGTYCSSLGVAQPAGAGRTPPSSVGAAGVVGRSARYDRSRDVDLWLRLLSRYPPGAPTWTCTLVAMGRRPPGSTFSVSWLPTEYRVANYRKQSTHDTIQQLFVKKITTTTVVESQSRKSFFFTKG